MDFEKMIYNEFLALNLIALCAIIALDRHVRNAELEIVGRPVLELRNAIGVLVQHGKVREQHARRVRSDEDQHVPDGVQIREIRTPPRVAVELVRYPAGQCQRQHNAAAQSEAQNAHVALAGKRYNRS